MKRLVIMTILKMCAKAIGFTLMAGIVVGVIGYTRKWNTPIAYSNAFFIAGCLMIAAGGLSRLGAGQEWKVFSSFHSESLRHMSSSEFANFIIDASSSASLVILGISSGILLIIIAVLVMKIF